MTDKVVITGSSGRIGRAIFWQSLGAYSVEGLDRLPSSSTTVVGDISRKEDLLRVFDGASIVFHTASLHAPHVSVETVRAFEKTNIEGTRLVCEAAREAGVRCLVFSSTTALYGYANQDEKRTTWIDENTVPKPRTIYHRTKLDAEVVAKDYASEAFAVRIIRLSRCFPEPADHMAIYRLHRGVDYRDVASAHLAAGRLVGADVETFIISGRTPFLRSDCRALKSNAAEVIQVRAPEVAREFEERGWTLPTSIDRVYDSAKAARVLRWDMQMGPEQVFTQYDNRDFEVLPLRERVHSED